MEVQQAASMLEVGGALRGLSVVSGPLSVVRCSNRSNRSIIRLRRIRSNRKSSSSQEPERNDSLYDVFASWILTPDSSFSVPSA